MVKNLVELPVELLLHIFSFLPHYIWHDTLSLVCTRFKRILLHKHLIQIVHITPEDFFIGQNRKLRIANISQNIIFQLLKSYNNLREIYIHKRVDIDLLVEQILTHNKKLEKIEIINDDQSIRHISPHTIINLYLWSDKQYFPLDENLPDI